MKGNGNIDYADCRDGLPLGPKIDKTKIVGHFNIYSLNQVENPRNQPDV